MGIVYIFRGKAATGKTTLSNMLAKELSLPVFRKDDIIDGLKMSENIDNAGITNEVYYNILYKIIQTNLDLNVDFILGIALGDRKNADWFFGRLNFHDYKIVSFFVDCSDRGEWERRHRERLASPLPHQTFTSFEHVLKHYENADINPFDNEYVIDNSGPVCSSFNTVMKILRDIK